MSIPSPYRITATFLVAAILLFSAGIPVTRYLCPMMSADSPTCDMSVPSFGDTPSIANQTPACCAKYIIAERNSTPYLKSENPNDVTLFLALIAYSQFGEPRMGWSTPLLHQDAGPPGSDLPLYLLKSSLLI